MLPKPLLSFLKFIVFMSCIFSVCAIGMQEYIFGGLLLLINSFAVYVIIIASPKNYFLTFEKSYGLRKGKAVFYMHRKDKFWLLTHRLNEAEKLNIFQLKWHYFLFRLYRKHNKRFFGYQRPHGVVKKNKMLVPVPNSAINAN